MIIMWKLTGSAPDFRPPQILRRYGSNYGQIYSARFQLRRRYYGAGNFRFNYPSKSGTIVTGLHILVLYSIFEVAEATAAAKTAVKAAAAAAADLRRPPQTCYGSTSITKAVTTAPAPQIPEPQYLRSGSGISGGGLIIGAQGVNIAISDIG